MEPGAPVIVAGIPPTVLNWLVQKGLEKAGDQVQDVLDLTGVQAKLQSLGRDPFLAVTRDYPVLQQSISTGNPFLLLPKLNSIVSIVITEPPVPDPPPAIPGVPIAPIPPLWNRDP